MRLVRYIILFVTISVALFGLLILPGFASKADVPSSPGRQAIQPLEASSTFSAQMTFTPVATIYLPIVIGSGETPPSNGDLEITDLVPDGSDEYVEITNNGSTSQSMNGWQIVSVVGSQTYDFPDGITLGVGQTLRVHSGSGAINNPPTDLLWTGAFIWNNSGDKAELKDNLGAVRDSFCYDDGCP